MKIYDMLLHVIYSCSNFLNKQWEYLGYKVRVYISSISFNHKNFIFYWSNDKHVLDSTYFQATIQLLNKTNFPKIINLYQKSPKIIVNFFKAWNPKIFIFSCSKYVRHSDVPYPKTTNSAYPFHYAQGKLSIFNCIICRL